MPDSIFYTLTSDKGIYTLSVQLDDSGAREYNHVLNSGETYRYESQGESFLELLAREIRENPEGFGKVADDELL